MWLILPVVKKAEPFLCKHMPVYGEPAYLILGDSSTWSHGLINAYFCDFFPLDNLNRIAATETLLPLELKYLVCSAYMQSWYT